METPQAPRPWWKFGHVGRVIAGPLIVVVAGFVTLYLAIRTPDPVIQTQPTRQAADGDSGGTAMTPAQAARNHAATGGAAPTPKP